MLYGALVVTLWTCYGALVVVLSLLLLLLIILRQSPVALYTLSDSVLSGPLRELTGLAPPSVG